jgi:hypothetical protein
MSAEWLDALELAAIQADAAVLHQQIQQIPDTYSSLIQSLTFLVDHYDYDSILELTQALVRQSR